MALNDFTLGEIAELNRRYGEPLLTSEQVGRLHRRPQAIPTWFLSSVQTLLAGATAIPLEDFYRLRSAGIVSGEASGAATFRCRLYEDYFRRHLT